MDKSNQKIEFFHLPPSVYDYNKLYDSTKSYNQTQFFINNKSMNRLDRISFDRPKIQPDHALFFEMDDID